ncbi:MAG: F0F1 ATP synthase subunit delta [Rhodobacteraceae bacterium]|nr:F0F1 ATP synthase subunit delta [Paracoccaceae bacterium]
MSKNASISSGIASRYATALFELALEADALDQLDTDMNALRAALAESADLRDLIVSPVHSREVQGAAIGAIAAKMGLSELARNTLALMARNRRLFVLPHLAARVLERIAAHRGEITAEVRAARPLTKTQQEKLARALKAAVGKDVNIDLTVDEALIGGLVVKVGSKMIDSSIAARLAPLRHVMKEVG